jgi:hypothetical protein
LKLSEYLPHLLHMLLSVLAIDKDIIYIDRATLVQVVPKYFVDIPLKGR